MTVGSPSPSAGSTAPTVLAPSVVGSADGPPSETPGQGALPAAAIPTSRAYWELKAEQMMNRLFAPEPAIDLEPEPAPGLVAPRKGP